MPWIQFNATILNPHTELVRYCWMDVLSDTIAQNFIRNWKDQLLLGHEGALIEIRYGFANGLPGEPERSRMILHQVLKIEEARVMLGRLEHNEPASSPLPRRYIELLREALNLSAGLLTAEHRISSVDEAMELRGFLDALIAPRK